MNRPKTSIRRALRSPRGASAVEFALIAPLFFMVTFGMISGAIALNQKNQLTHAARESARFGATLSPNTPITPCPGGDQGACWAQKVADIAVERAFGELAPTVPGRGICVALVTGASATPLSTYKTSVGSAGFTSAGNCFTETGSSDPGQRVQVRVKRNGELNAILFQMDLTLNSNASSRMEDEL